MNEINKLVEDGQDSHWLSKELPIQVKINEFGV